MGESLEYLTKVLRGMAIKMESGFEILRLSDLSYEYMTVELQFKGVQILQLNKDKGVSKIELELFTDCMDPQCAPKFFLDDFLTALNEARKLLESC